MKNNSKYIILEGIDGTGKDTQALLLSDHFNSKNLKNVIEKEPDESHQIGKLIRTLLQNGEHKHAHCALFLADRLASEQKRKDLLNNDTNIICTRSFLSTLVYQSMNWDEEWLYEIHKSLTLKPDFIFVLTLQLEESLKRISERKQQVESKAYENEECLKWAINKYNKWIKIGNIFNIPIIEINATKSSDKIHKEILNYIKNY